MTDLFESMAAFTVPVIYLFSKDANYTVII